MFNKKKKKTARDPGRTIILNNRFLMDFPEEWKDDSIYRYEGPIIDGIRHVVYINIENNVSDMGLEKYAAKNIHAIETGLKGYQELKQGPLTLASGRQGYELVYKWCPAEEKTVYQRVVYILEKDTGYILTASFSKKTWKIFGSTVDKILMSFRIPKLKPEA